MSNQRVFLIDGTAFCYRAFYAIRNLSTADGRPTNAVYGFAVMLQALRDKEHPEYLAVAFDVGKPTFRHQKFEQYKIQRKPMPDALIGQIPVVKRLLAAYRIPVFEQEGYEGEDVLATIAKRVAVKGLEVFLVTGDKDALQLVNSHVKVYNPHHDGAVLDAAAVKARYGVGPERMVDLMALMGDDIDNIPGVPGIGEKTATQLLQQFGSLEQLYESLNDLDSPVQRRKLETAREQAMLSQELARIDAEVPLTMTLEDLALREPDWRALRALLRELEFKRLLGAIDEKAPAGRSANIHRRVAQTPQDLETFLQAVGRSTVALGCWPAPPPRMLVGGPIGTPLAAVTLAAATDAGTAWVIRLDRSLLGTPAGRRFSEWLADPEAPKLFHDAKAAMGILKRMEVTLRGISGDTMVAAYLLNPARTEQTLSDLSDEYLDTPLRPVPALDGGAELDAEVSLEPCAEAACVVIRLHELLQPKLTEQGMAALYADLELPLLAVLARMETDGIAIDVPYLAGLRAAMDAKLLALTETIYELAGTSFNLNSPKQLAQVLFERLNLPVVKRTKTGASTDSSVLQQLAEHHPLPKHLIEYRELSKLVSTYVAALPKLVDPATGRLHTSFNQTATATGRLSSSEPNLQNIPIKTEIGRSIRKAFIPGHPDGLLMAADYSQIELRILAHLSGDEQLTDAFRRGRDIHRVTASLIYGLPEAEVQAEQRNAMKAVNYGILYGMTSHGLSKELGISFEEAQAFIDAYFERYPKVRCYLDSQIAQAKRDGYVQTLLARRRYIPEVNSADMVLRQVGERMAVNAPIQGTAADLIKRAMVQVAAALASGRIASRMVLQVHDELVFETTRQELNSLVRLVQRIMEGAIVLDVPLEVTMKTGPNWLDLREVQ
jgi:DNA polymerase-1